MKKLYFNLSCLLLITLFFFSCATPQPQNKQISKAQAESVISGFVGTVKPETNLYHTYEKTKQTSEYWKGALTSRSSTTNIMTLSKIEGNFVEGTINSTSNGVIESPAPFFGRFNDEYLYIYVTTPGYWPYIAKYQITENSRMLIYREIASHTTPYSTLVWKNAPKLDVRIEYPNPRGWSINKSTGYVSQTDDYVGEKGSKNKGGEQTLTEKLKELKGLLDNKLITKQEYDTLRKKLMKN